MAAKIRETRATGVDEALVLMHYELELLMVGFVLERISYLNVSLCFSRRFLARSINRLLICPDRMSDTRRGSIR